MNLIIKPLKKLKPLLIDEKEMITNLKNLINKSNPSRINNFFLQKFNDEKFNFKTLNRFFV